MLPFRKSEPTTRIEEPLHIAARPWRPRPSLLLVGVVLVLASVLGVGALINTVSGEQSVLVLAQTVPAGQVITAGDLSIVNVSKNTAGLSLVNASQEQSIIGRLAAVTLVAGESLTEAELGPVQIPAGMAEMGILAKPGQYPPDVAAGDTVEIIDGGSTTSAAAAPLAAPVLATVESVEAPQGSAYSGEIISVQLSSQDAVMLAPAVAAGAITLVLVAAGS
jgi:hypothetical protein